MLGESPIYSFFIFRSHQRCKKSVQKEKLQSRKLKLCARQTSFSAIFLLDKITAPKFLKNPHLKQDLRPLRQWRFLTKT